MAVHQLHNAHLVVQLLISIYLVDFVLNPLVPAKDLAIVPDKIGYLVFIIFLNVMFRAALHFADFRKYSWKVAGGSRSLLQKSIIRKFLNLDENARLGIHQGDVVLAVMRDAVKIVHDGYMNVLSIMHAAGELLCILAFQCIAPPLLGKQQSLSLLLPVFSYPIILSICLTLRRKTNLQCLHAQIGHRSIIVERINATVSNYRLIADFSQRAFFVDWFDRTVQEYNKASTSVSQVQENNVQIAQWITTLCVAGWTVWGGALVVWYPETASLGMFLANIRILNVLGSTWGNIYRLALALETIFPALLRITELLNLPTDIPRRDTLSQHCVSETMKARAALRDEIRLRDGAIAANAFIVDLLPIRLANLKFSLNGKVISFSNSMTVQQGQLVAVLGRRREGKSLLLRVLGGAVLPTLEPGSDFFIPSHLRVLHVPNEKLFIRANLMRNLTFGVGKAVLDDEDRRRAIRIIRRLGMRDDTVDLVNSEEVYHWGEVLSQTQRSLLCLARALVTNPEVLVLHKPTEGFDEITSHYILHLLDEFKRERGVELFPDPDLWRRKRTIIMSSSKMVGIALTVTDAVFHVSTANGITQMDKEHLSQHLLT
eukprot:gnl/TRDRNA2_/TRDRNA2_120057_c0_seq1.p1 gnl/TRDRNA2_/TRDRNA2_120057_c0~~gnl/TRDRNA2_/TRDRNA2_120057_c0_seq1.p1  ORF type:complete len:701 (-),score=77.89 gnl/TRDRNA2_/TRDRNA2_120057_c0_seq1:104-1903(-)